MDPTLDTPSVLSQDTDGIFEMENEDTIGLDGTNNTQEGTTNPMFLDLDTSSSPESTSPPRPNNFFGRNLEIGIATPDKDGMHTPLFPGCDFGKKGAQLSDVNEVEDCERNYERRTDKVVHYAKSFMNVSH